MSIKSYFFNAVQSGNTYDRIYNAEDVTSYLDLIVGNGVFADPSTNLQVSAGSAMQVIVAAGQGWINGHKMINTAALPLTIEQSDVVLDRIDAVIFYVDYDERDMGIEVLTGTAAASPVAPTLTQTDERYELCLAQVYVGKQVTSITNSNITDTRSDSDLCGYVAGLIDQIDASTLFQQWQSEFDDWFDEVKDELVTATLIRKYNYVYTTSSASEDTFDVATLIPEYAYLLDILEIRINGLSLTTSEYTKSGSTVTLNTPVAETGTPIEFVIYKSVDGSDAESIVDLVYDLQTELEATRITSATGGVQLSLTDSSANVLTSFVNLGVGFHTLYAGDSVGGVPDAKAARFFGHMTTATVGYLFAVNYEGSVYANYYASGTWTGWRTLYDADPSLLYYTPNGAYPIAGVEVTPSKALSECQHGWIMTFTGYSNSAGTDTFGQNILIPKVSYKGADWNGEVMTFPLLYDSSGSLCIKSFEVYDDKLVSLTGNNASPSTNMVLRSIQEY